MIQGKNGIYTIEPSIERYVGIEESKITSRNRGTQTFDMTLDELVDNWEHKDQKYRDDNNLNDNIVES